MKKNLKWFLVMAGLVWFRNAKAQATLFLEEGKIEYEKKFNLYAQIESMHGNDDWAELSKKRFPKFKTTYFDLLFSGSRTLYKPGKENPENNMIWEQPAEDNRVYSELDNSKSVSQKKVFGDLFLVKDSTRKINWKITPETRFIAGFNCRRANAIIMDSIYVVAFYCEDILTPGGPESFNGLPGMILGIALPHQHITWFATKVQAIPVNHAELTAPSKGKKISNHELKETLQERLKDWGRWAQVYEQSTQY
jgi:GLPGLI family protein